MYECLYLWCVCVSMVGLDTTRLRLWHISTYLPSSQPALRCVLWLAAVWPISSRLRPVSVCSIVYIVVKMRVCISVVKRAWYNVWHNFGMLLLAVGGWPISQPPRAEAFSRPNAQPVSTQRCVCVCVSAPGWCVRICICVCCEQSLSSLF